MEEQPVGKEEIAKIHAKAMRLCSRQEKCIYDMCTWYARKGVPSERIPDLVEDLVEQHFVDDARYAEAYAKEKMRLSKWGANKIAAMLRGKRIDEAVISDAIARAEEECGGVDLDALLEKKAIGLLRGEVDAYQVVIKLMQFSVGRGFGLQESKDAASRVVRRLLEERGE